jgi:hypothetical protein
VPFPDLVAWVLNMSNVDSAGSDLGARVTLSFRAPVNMSTFNVSSLSIQSGSGWSPAVNYRLLALTGGVQSSSDGLTQTLLLAQADTEALKLLSKQGFATSPANSYLSISHNSGILDLVVPLDGHRERAGNNSVQAAIVAADSVGPFLTSFQLFDRNASQIALVFNEPVLASSFNSSAVLFGKSFADNAPLRLSAGSNLSSTDGNTVVLPLGIADLSAFELSRLICSTGATCFISFERSMITDINGNAVRALSNTLDINTILVRQPVSFVSLTTGPALLSFGFNMTAGVLQLTFSSIVSRASLDMTAVQLQTAQDASVVGTAAVNLTGGSSSSSDGRVLAIRLTAADILSLKEEGIGLSSLTTFISIRAGLVQDLAIIPNPSQTIPAAQGLRVNAAQFGVDVVAPNLLSFSMRLDTGTVTLTFDEPVAVMSVNTSRLRFKNALNGMIFVSLVSSTVAYGNKKTVLNVSLSLEDMTSILSTNLIGYALASSFIELSTGFVSDVSSNAVNAVSMRAAEVVSATVGPMLLSFDLNMSSGALGLTFDKAIRTVSFQPTKLHFQSQVGDASVSFSLSRNSTLATADGTVALVLLGPQDLNGLKTVAGLCVDTNSTFLTMDSTALTSAALPYLPVRTITETQALRVTLFTRDSIAPNVVAFSINFASGLLVLTFDEPVWSVNASNIVLQSEAARSLQTQSLALSGQSVVMQLSYLRYSVTLTVPDLDLIANRYPLGTDASTTFLSVSQGVAVDFAGNAANGIATSQGLGPATFTSRPLRPRLVSFQANLLVGTIAMTFSSPINVSTLLVTELVLQSSSTAAVGTMSLRLSESTTVAPPGGSGLNTTVELQLGQVDVDGIALRAGLWRALNSTFLTVGSVLAAAADGSTVITISSTAALPASSYVADSSAVIVQSWSLNLMADPSQMSLSFNKIINVAAFNISALLLQSGMQNPSHVVALNGTVHSFSGRNVTMQLDRAAVMLMKSGGVVCRDGGSCFLRVPGAAVSDLMGNTGGNASDGIAVGLYQGDLVQPMLLAFSSINMQTRQMVLSFSEPLNVSTFVCSGLQLQTLFESPASQLALGSNCTVQGSQLNTVVTVTFSQADLFAIQLDQLICTQRATCYVAFGAGLVQDMAGNPIAAGGQTSPGFLAASFVGDTTAPALSAFDLDMRLGLLALSFSKPVSESSLVVSRLAVQNGLSVGAGSNETRVWLSRLSSVSNASSDRQTVLVALDAADVSALKTSKVLAKSPATTFLIAQTGAVRDLLLIPNAMAAVQDGAAVAVRQYTSDDVPPELTEAALDLSNGLLRLVFNEPVLAAQLNLSGLWIQNQSSAVNGLAVRLTATSQSQNSDGSVVVGVRLSAEDLQALKTTGNTATSINTTFVALADGALRDMANNSVVVISQSSAVQVRSFVPDSNLARLTNFSLDMNGGVLALTFNALVNPATFVASGITLQSSMAAVSGRVSLSGSSTTNSSVGYTMTVYLAENDIVAVKLVSGLARSVGTTFITLVGAVQDYRGNDVLAVTNGFAVRAGRYTPDTTAPTLLSFDFNASDVTMVLRFSKAVDASSLNISQATLQSLSNGGSGLSLTVGSSAMSTLSADRKDLHVNLDASDKVALKASVGLCSSPSSCFLSFSSSLVNDLIGQAVVAVPSSSARTVSAFGADVVPPRLTGFSLDMSARLLMLTFSEVCNVTAFNGVNTVVLFQSSSGAGSVALNGLAVVNSSGLVVVASLGASDFVALKSQLDVGVSQASSFVEIAASLIVDNAGNSVSARGSGSRLQANAFTADALSPTLLQFSLDMNAGVLSLTFNEPVNPSSLSVDRLVLQDAPNASATVGIISQAVTAQLGVVANITLSAVTQNAIKSLPSVGRSTGSTYVSGAAGFVQDTSANNVTGISSQAGLQASAVLVDTQPPGVTGFVADLTVGVLSITFDEVINVSTLQPSRLALQSALITPTAQVNLSASVVTTGGLAAAVVNISLGGADRDAIALSQIVGRDASSTWLLLRAGSVVDMYGNVLQADTTAAAVQVRADSVVPQLQQFTLDMTSRVLSLTFTKPMNASSFGLARSGNLTLQSQASGLGAVSFALSTATMLTTSNGAVQNLTLGVDDTNAVKARPPLCTTSGSCFLVVAGGTMTDMFGNANAAVSGLGASSFAASLTSPLMSAFTLDMNTGALILSFSETVNVSTLNTSKLQLQDHGASRTEQLRMEAMVGVGHGASAFSDRVTVTLSNAQLNAIKASSMLGKNASTTFLSSEGGLVLSMSGIASPAVPVTSALGASVVTADTTAPLLVSWSADYNTGALVLVFDEFVAAQSTQMGLIQLSSQASVGGPGVVSLSNSTLLVTIASEQVTVVLSAVDWAQGEALQPTAGSAYLRLLGGAIQDLAGNAVASMSANLGAGSLIEHARATAQAFELNMNTGVATVLFDRAMLSSFVDVSRIAVQSADGQAVVQLTGGSIVGWSNGNNRSLVLSLTATDLAHIKLQSAVGKNASSSVLSLQVGAFKDGTRNPKGSSAVVLAASVYTADTTAPALLSVAVDMNQGRIVLNFNEPVLMSSFNVSGVRAMASTSLSVTVGGGGVVALSHQNSTVSTLDSQQLTLQLGSQDLDAIGLSGVVFRTSASGVVGLVSNSVTDIAGNPLATVVMQASVFVGDANVPQILSFDFDMNTGILVVRFSKVMNASSVRFDCLVLQSASNSANGQMLRLDGTVPLSNGRLLTILLASPVVRQLKDLSIGLQSSSTWLRACSGFAVDMTGLAVSPLVDGVNALAVSSYVPDTTLPALASFVFSVDTGLMLSFSEPVPALSLNVSKLAVFTNASGMLWLSSGAVFSDSMTATIGFSVELSNRLKSFMPQGFRLPGNTFLAIEAGAFVDVFGNANTAVGGMQPASIVADVVAPTLTGFEASMDATTHLQLTFSETMNFSSTNVSAVVLVNQAGDETYRLTGGTVTGLNLTVGRITLSTADSNALRAFTSLMRSLANARISFAPWLIADMSRNGVSVANSPFSATAYAADRKCHMCAFIG